ncbi:hypothetical protein N7478_006363 [Penicillium angulare]|uniref:uncharacterized protein n=1 Tax=Penicillium angulare TaxID=116970 RepID=UPI002541DC61|nr:uncharacterized protein N7478_006363 [Penicillium angulare]KAJ5280991.1 hypothetical protein N7478_006363 [Penicillium angulare]
MTPAKVAANEGRVTHNDIKTRVIKTRVTKTRIIEESDNPIYPQKNAKPRNSLTSNGTLQLKHRPADKIWKSIPKLPGATGNDQQCITNELEQHTISKTLVLYPVVLADVLTVTICSLSRTNNTMVVMGNSAIIRKHIKHVHCGLNVSFPRVGLYVASEKESQRWFAFCPEVTGDEGTDDDDEDTSDGDN